MPPAVTVLMSAHNAAPYVGEAVESILTQTCQDFEFVIVDDGSTDATVEVIRRYADPRIQLLQNSHKAGLARSLNIGLRAARGALIARQDADDVSEPGRLERECDLLYAHPEIGLVGCGYVEIDEHGMAGASHQLPAQDLEIRWALLFHCPFVHTGVIFRASVVPASAGFYDESFAYSMDYELWTRVAKVTRMANLSGSLVRLRVHASSMTATCGASAFEGIRLRRDRLCRVLALDSENAADAARVEDLMRRVNKSERLEARDLEALGRIHRAFQRQSALPSEVASAHWESLLMRWSVC